MKNENSKNSEQKMKSNFDTHKTNKQQINFDNNNKTTTTRQQQQDNNNNMASLSNQSNAVNERPTTTHSQRLRLIKQHQYYRL